MTNPIVCVADRGERKITFYLRQNFGDGKDDA